jgi:energy-converting hydrogenase Eha subunit E
MEKEPAHRSKPLLWLGVAVASLVVRLFGIFVTFARRLALLTRFLAAALLLTGFLTRCLILLAGLDLVRHVVSFHRNIITTALSSRRSDKTKAAVRIVATMRRSVRRILIAPLAGNAARW